MIKKVFLFLMIILLITGCYDYNELDNMNIIDAIYVDFIDNSYEVTLEIISLNNNKELQKEYLSNKGTSISEAFNEIKKKSSKEVFLEHVEILGISENLGKKGVREIFDYIIRDVDINNNYYVVMVDDMESFKKVNDSIGSYLTKYINNIYLENDVFTIDMLEKSLINEDKDIAIPYIKDMKSTQLATFIKDKLNGFINNDIYNLIFLKNGKVLFENNKTVLNVYNSKILYDVKKDKIIIHVFLEGKVLETNKELDNYKDIEELNNTFEEEIENKINSYFDSLNESDIFGFKNMYYKKYGVTKDIKIESKVKLKINKDGALLK